MQIPLVDLRAQYAAIQPEIDAAMKRVLDHCGFILGEEVAQFERAFADYVGARGAVGVSSGTAALRLALDACGIGEGHKVITSAHTFIATAEAISHVRGVPVFADIDPRTFTLDPAQVERAIREHQGRSAGRITAIMPVHLYGQPADMEALRDIARRYDLRIIEDAAQAHGAEWSGRRCGTLGDLACFSFYPGKNLGAYGDAGMVTGNDEALLAAVRRLRDHGRLTKYEHERVGWGERLDALQAAVLSVKLRYLEDWTERRRAHAALYTKLLEGHGVDVPYAATSARHVFHLYVVRAPQRDAMLRHLKAKGIGAGIHYPVPLHRQPAYVQLGYGDLQLPNTERAAAEVLSLPMYPELTREKIEYVAAAVKDFRA